MFRQLGNRVGEAIGLLHLGEFALYQGDDEGARASLGQALAIAREISYRGVEGESELRLGEAAILAGDRDEAAARFASSLAVCRGAGDRRGEANAQRWLGKAALDGGDLASARRRLGDALRDLAAFEMREEMVDCLEDHVALSLREGRPEHAAQLAGAVAQARVRLALARPPRDERAWRALVDRLHGELPDDRFDAAWNRGQGWETREAVREALVPAGNTAVRG